jgi:hypothetical protein
MIFYPVLSDIYSSAQPNIVEREYIVKELCESFDSSWLSDESGMESDGHHFGGVLRFLVEGIEVVFDVREEVVSGSESEGRAKTHIVIEECVWHDEVRFLG